jgi:predicted RNase H-like HicB family nuclease
MQEIQGSTTQLKRGGMMYYQEGGEEEEDEEGYGYEYEEEPNYMINKPSLMGKQQNFTQRELATSPAIESAVEATSSTKEEETPSYDKNSARDTWVAKTGMPWSEAKRLGYTSGTDKDNRKLLSELNDPRFKKEYLRKSSPKGEKTYNGGQLKEVVVTRHKKDNYVDPYKGWYNDSEGNLRNAKGVMVGLDGKPLNFLERNFSSSITLPPLDDSGRRMPRLRANATAEEANAYHLAQYKNKIRRQKELEDVWGKIPSSTPFIKYQDGGEQQIAQQVAQAMQQGMQPQEAMAMLMESGMTEDQAIQLVQAIMEQVQQQSQQMEEGTPQMRRGGYYQDGGEEMDEQIEEENEGMENESAMSEQIEDQVEQALKQGADPQQILQQLVQMGMSEEEAMQMIQEILQEMQGGEEEEEGTPQMSKGGKYMRALVGKTIKNYTYNPKTDSYIVSYE